MGFYEQIRLILQAEVRQIQIRSVWMVTRTQSLASP
jgi:hypothetical protein